MRFLLLVTVLVALAATAAARRPRTQVSGLNSGLNPDRIQQCVHSNARQRRRQDSSSSDDSSSSSSSSSSDSSSNSNNENLNNLGLDGNNGNNNNNNNNNDASCPVVRPEQCRSRRLMLCGRCYTCVVILGEGEVCRKFIPENTECAEGLECRDVRCRRPLH